MSYGWDSRTVIETAVSHRWARRIQPEPPLLAAARNVLRRIRLTGNNCWKYAKVWFKHQLAQKKLLNVGLAVYTSEVYTNVLYSQLSFLYENVL